MASFVRDSHGPSREGLARQTAAQPVFQPTTRKLAGVSRRRGGGSPLGAKCPNPLALLAKTDFLAIGKNENPEKQRGQIET